MKYDLALLVELVAASLLRSQAAENGLAVVIHESLRTLPVLESAGATAYVNLAPLAHRDFRPVPGGLPAGKERVCSVFAREDANALVRRARVVVLCVPNDPAAIAALPDLDSAGKLCLIYGEPRAAGWSHITPRLRGGDFTPFEIGGARLLISREAVDGVGGRQMMMPTGIDNLTVAVGSRSVLMNRIDYTEYGAVLALPPTEVEAGRDALLFLSLPRTAVPQDGFCDIGAVTQTLELVS